MNGAGQMIPLKARVSETQVFSRSSLHFIKLQKGKKGASTITLKPERLAKMARVNTSAEASMLARSFLEECAEYKKDEDEE